MVIECSVIEAAPARANPWLEKPLALLMDHIVEMHHAYTRIELARLCIEAERVAAAHGSRFPCLMSLPMLLSALEDELRPHLAREELILFPYINAVENAVRARRTKPLARFGSMRSPILAMMLDHDHAAGLLRALREETSSFVSPAGAPPRVSVLYGDLEAFERDLDEHLFLETQVLFPRALALVSTEPASSLAPTTR